MEGSPADHPSAPPNLTADPQDLSNVSHNQVPHEGTSRKPKGPSVRKACAACHAGKTRCSESLPCQSCLKRGLGDSCSYPDPEVSNPPSVSHGVPGYSAQALAYPPIGGMPQQAYYEYSQYAPAAAAAAAVTPAAAPTHSAPPQGPPTPASTASYRPSKRPRTLTEEETAAISRYTRGDFFVGSSAPVRIDPRLPVRLTLGEGDQVHFVVGHENSVFPP